MSLLIRGATMIDGLGHEPKRADVLVKDGKIADIGDIKGQAEQTIDAGGLTLTPGIVDVHTHYDAQVTWDATLSPSPSLGVTTAVMGNCGFGIAPALPQSRDLVIKNLSVVEGMDLDAQREQMAMEGAMQENQSAAQRLHEVSLAKQQAQAAKEAQFMKQQSEE